MTVAELRRLCNLARSEPDTEECGMHQAFCRRCKALMQCQPEDEPTPLCHQCTHEVLDELADGVLLLLDAQRQSRRDRKML